MKLNNLTITPKLGILVGVTLLGLCAAGALAGYLMQQEMLNARIDQVHSIVEIARNMAVGLQKEVDAGKLTKEAAIAEFGRRANSMTYDNGDGYLFGSTMDGVTVLSPDPKQIGVRTGSTSLTNGRAIGREWRDNVAAKGEHTMFYDYLKPGQETAAPQGRLCGRDPRLEHVCRHRRLSRRSRCQAEADHLDARPCDPRHRRDRGRASPG